MLATIAPQRSAEHHVALGGALERMTNGSTAQAAALSRHFALGLAAGSAEAAMRWARIAADQARSVWAMGETIVHLERARAAEATLEDEDPARRCALLLDIAEAIRHLPQAGDGEDHRYEALRIAESLGNPELLTRAALSLTTGAGTGRNQPHQAPTEADLHIVERALDRLPPDGFRHRAELLAGLAADAYNLHTTDEREALFGAAIAHSRQLGDERLEVSVRLQRRVSLAWKWSPDERLRESESLLDAALRLGMPEDELLIRQHLIMEALNHADPVAFDRRMAELEAHAQIRGTVTARMALAMWQVAAAQMRAEWERCDALVERAMDPHQGFGDELGFRFLAAAAVIDSYRGDYTQLELFMRAAVATTNRRFFPRFHFAVLVGGGRFDEARGVLRSLDFSRLDGGNIGGQHSLAICCEPLARLGELGPLPQIVEQLEPLASHLVIGMMGGGWVFNLGTMRYPLARACIALGRYDDAQTHIEAGRRQCQPLAMRTHLLELDLAEAWLLATRDGLTAAAPSLDATMATALELGMKGIAGQVDECRSVHAP